MTQPRRYTQWALRTQGTTGRVLMRRYADEDGFGLDGAPSAWRDVATFSSYNDADEVLRRLTKDGER